MPRTDLTLAGKISKKLSFLILLKKLREAKQNKSNLEFSLRQPLLAKIYLRLSELDFDEKRLVVELLEFGVESLAERETLFEVLRVEVERHQASFERLAQISSLLLHRPLDAFFAQVDLDSDRCEKKDI